MKRGSTKEPVGKKNSGIGKLMSVLHQNAASLVTTRTAHNGPDQVIGWITEKDIIPNTTLPTRCCQVGQN